jgi:diacylglycerol kinase (ATP)
MTSTIAIVNPQSASGRTAQAWSRIRSALPPMEVRYTNAPEHAIELTASALKRGVKTVIAVGGDGTINEVVNGFFDGDRLIASDATLGIIPVGTGSDFRRSINVPADVKAASALLQTAPIRRIDVMRVRYTTLNAANATRYSINVTSFGMGAAVAASASRSSKMLGGKIAFLIATGMIGLGYRGKRVTLQLDDQAAVESVVTNVAVGNGQYHGAGMWVCPRAALDDGLLDVTVIRYMNVWQIARSIRRLYNGKIYSHPDVEAYRAARLRADCSEETLIEIDGESLGKLPVEIEVMPGAIRILAY